MSEKKQCSCGCSSSGSKTKYQNIHAIGNIASDAGNIDVVSTKWRICDYMGQIKVRLNIGRMNYSIAPGIYAVGHPDSKSPVLVSANYKFSFDVLRRELKGIDAWILVIDTKGVNVWCAAGKGTFGTQELVKMVKITQLEKITDVRNLIVPQLGASGVSAHKVKTLCGFYVIYGPVRACDIKKFIHSGMKADKEMRLVFFNLIDRLAVSWLALIDALKISLIVTIVLFGLSIFPGNIAVLAEFKSEVLLLLILFWASVLSGTILNAIFLPFIPGRAFSFKGGLLSAFICAGIIYVFGQGMPVITIVSFILICSSVSAFQALKFTGASTYTSLSGVTKEIRYSIPVIISMLSVGALLEIVHIVRKIL